MFSLQISRYSICKLMIQVLKMVKSKKIAKIKGPREAHPWDLTKNMPGGAGLRKLLKVYGGGGGGGDGNVWS